MKIKRAVTYSAALAALVAWWAGASTSTVPQGPVPMPPEPVQQTGSDPLAVEIRRLGDRTSRMVAPQQPARNPFRFATPPPSATLQPMSDEHASTNAAQPAVARAPALTLIGLAEDEGPEGTIRTAIISGAGDLFIVKEGEAVTRRFRVSRISADVVELADSDGTFLRLTLK